MTSTRPYLFRAFYQWIVDNQLTPHIVIDAETSGIDIPKQYIRDNQIVLNISPDAIRDLEISNNEVQFDVRFSGIIYNIQAPMQTILALYALENGRGIVFEDEPDADNEQFDHNHDISAHSNDNQTNHRPKGKPKLSIVK